MHFVSREPNYFAGLYERHNFVHNSYLAKLVLALSTTAQEQEMYVPSMEHEDCRGIFPENCCLV